jgi:hypothetical protein
MIRTTTLLLAGTLFTAGCQHSVYGDRSFKSNNVYGPGYEFPRNPVYGDASFRNPVNGPTDVTRPPSDSARPASDRVISPRPDTVVAAAPAPQPVDVPRDEVARSTTTTENEPRPTDRSSVDSTPAPTPPPSDRPAVAPAPQLADRPTATTDKPAVPHDIDVPTTPGVTGGRDPERVARANSARYPDDLKPSDDLRAVATVDRANRTLRIQNYSAHDVRGGDLWVSETYVSPIPDIASGGSAAVPLNQFFDRDGRPLPALTETSKLQLQTAGKLYNIPLQPEDLNK